MNFLVLQMGSFRSMQVNPCDLSMCLWYTLELWNFLIFPLALEIQSIFPWLGYTAEQVISESFLMLAIVLSNSFNSLRYLLLPSVPNNTFIKKSIPTNMLNWERYMMK